MTPRAVRWRDTLIDLAAMHHNERFKQMADRIDREHVQVRKELTADDERGILQAASDLLKG